jgi:hypothetical protein
MAETFAQYTERILGFASGREPMEILASTAARLHDLVDGRTAAELSAKPHESRWSVGEILAHLADAEVVAAWRLRSILASNGTALQAFDQNAWASTFKYGEIDPAESLGLFESARAGNLALLKRVDPALHENYGMHAERGRESIGHLKRLYAGHDLNHVTQIEALLRS